MGSNPMPSTNRLFKQVPQTWSFRRVGRKILFEACGDFLQTPPPPLKAQTNECKTRLRYGGAGRSEEDGDAGSRSDHFQ